MSNNSLKQELMTIESPEILPRKYEINGIDVFFSRPVDQKSVPTGVSITHDGVVFPPRITSGAANSIRISPDNGDFPLGLFEVTLFGTSPPGGGSAIRSMPPAEDLDGEPRPALPALNPPGALPSGDNTPGGNFVFRFKISP